MKNIEIPVSPQICTKCILPATFPGVSFNERGVCNHCQKFENFKSTPEEKAEHQLRLQTLIQQSREASNEIDVLMAYSGGKDSTYSMRLLVEKYGAKVRAFTFDNGFISPQAIRNIKTVCTHLGVHPMIIKYDQDMINKVFRYGAENEMYPSKTMERASTICTICSGFFKSIALGYALDMGIPMIGYGWSPGQAPIQSSISKANPRFTKISQNNIVKPVVDVLGYEAQQYFLQKRHYEVPSEKWPTSVHPLAFEEYDEEAIKENIKELGWKYPKSVDTNSTNCLLNSFANQQHLDKYKFHPYAMEVAAMVRQGVMTREEGIEKIYTPQKQSQVKYAAKILYK